MSLPTDRNAEMIIHKNGLTDFPYILHYTLIQKCVMH